MAQPSASAPGDEGRRTIALVAHDACKDDLVAWALDHREALAEHELIATGTTGARLEEATGLPVQALQSGPLGGDLQIGALIADGEIDALIFLWDPLEAQPHEPDVRALLRISVVWNIALACNRATADHLICSPLLAGDYRPSVPDWGTGRPRTRGSAIDEPRAVAGEEGPA